MDQKKKISRNDITSAILSCSGRLWENSTTMKPEFTLQKQPVNPRGSKRSIRGENSSTLKSLEVYVLNTRVHFTSKSNLPTFQPFKALIFGSKNVEHDVPHTSGLPHCGTRLHLAIL